MDVIEDEPFTDDLGDKMVVNPRLFNFGVKNDIVLVTLTIPMQNQSL